LTYTLFTVLDVTKNMVNAISGDISRESPLFCM